MAGRLQESFAAFVYILLLCWAPRDAKRYTTPDFCDGMKSEKPLSFLWGVRRHPPSYFFGTIHVPYTRVWDFIPENAKQAFHESDNVFFELDLTKRRTLEALHRCQLMPRGRKLSDILPAKLFLRLKSHLEYVRRMIPRWMTSDQRGRGLYAEYLFTTITGNWERKRPVWVMLMVSSLTEGDIKWRGIPVLDLYLAQKASYMKKSTGAVEDVGEQCLPLNGLNFSQVIFALDQTLSRLERIRSGNSNESISTDDLVKHYNCKDMNAIIFNQDASQIIKLPQFSNGSYQSMEEGTAKMIDEYFRKELINKRNRRMGEKVSTILHNNPDKSYFFAFGAGHFLGNQTVLDVVEEGGFQIDHIPPDLKLKDFRKRYRNNKELPKLSFIQDFSPNKFNEDDATLSQILNEQKIKNMQTTSWTRHNTQQQQRRNFNELWVRMVPNPTRSAARQIPEDVVAEFHDPQGSLRVWYGVPSSTAATLSNYLIVIAMAAQSCLSCKSSWN